MTTTAIGTDSYIRKDSVKKGLVLGGIELVLSLISYYFIISNSNIPWLVLFGPFVLSNIVPLVIVVFFVLNTRKKIGGYWSFKRAVTSAFILLLTAYLLLSVTRDVLFVKLVEPNMIQKMETAMINSSTIMSKKQNLTPAQLNTRITDLKKGFDEQKNMTVFQSIGGYLVTILLLFVVAMAIAAILKKDPPEFVINQPVRE